MYIRNSAGGKNMKTKNKRKVLVAYCKNSSCRQSCIFSDYHRCGRGVHFLTKDKEGKYLMKKKEIDEMYQKYQEAYNQYE